MVIAERPVADAAARAHYWAEWQARAPRTPAEIAAFYREAEHLAGDLDVWHATPERQAWTKVVVGVARQMAADRRAALTIIDIGCGVGRDLQALGERFPDLYLHGVEPNERARSRTLRAAAIHVCADVADAPIAQADLLICIDVLEHLPEPEIFLTGLATRARLGTVLIEATGTADLTTPMHLPANQGWHPGHCLDANGWVLLDQQGRLRVWQRASESAPPRTAVLLCAYRSVGCRTLASLLGLVGVQGALWAEDNTVRLQRMAENPWSIIVKHGDGLIGRARSIVVSRWWAEQAGDCCLMLDDDIVFEPRDAERLVALCREKRSLVGAAYPVGDGGHLAVRQFPHSTIAFSPDARPLEVEYLATGMLAIHRDVIDSLMPTLPWLHADQPWAFKELFPTPTVPMGETLGLLSEDWGLSYLARQAGYRNWLDPTIRIQHEKTVLLSVGNMKAMHAAIQLGGTG